MEGVGGRGRGWEGVGGEGTGMGRGWEGKKVGRGWEGLGGEGTGMGGEKKEMGGGTRGGEGDGRE